MYRQRDLKGSQQRVSFNTHSWQPDEDGDDKVEGV